MNFHIRRHPISTLPTAREELGSWCTERWQEKETALAKFYTEGKDHLLLPGGEGDGFLDDEETEGSDQRILFGILLYWLVFLIVSFSLLLYSSIARWYFVIVVSFFFYQLVVGGGIERIIMESCQRYYGQKERVL